LLLVNLRIPSFLKSLLPNPIKVLYPILPKKYKSMVASVLATTIIAVELLDLEAGLLCGLLLRPSTARPSTTANYYAAIYHAAIYHAAIYREDPAQAKPTLAS
jgi:hypothetical protein